MQLLKQCSNVLTAAFQGIKVTKDSYTPYLTSRCQNMSASSERVIPCSLSLPCCWTHSAYGLVPHLCCTPIRALCCDKSMVGLRSFINLSLSCSTYILYILKYNSAIMDKIKILTIYEHLFYKVNIALVVIAKSIQIYMYGM